MDRISYGESPPLPMAKKSQNLARQRSAPFPQLLPDLDKRLHLTWAGKTVIDQSAILICLLVETLHCWQTKVCQAVTEFPQILSTQHLGLSGIGSSRHRGRILQYSLCIRHGQSDNLL